MAIRIREGSDPEVAERIVKLSEACDEELRLLAEIKERYNTQQHPMEIFWLMTIAYDVSSILEIGVSTGSIAMWSFLLPENGVYLGVYTEMIPFPDASYLVGRQIDVLTGDTHVEETIKRVKLALQGRKVDLLFINGDHSYESVKKDYESYKGFVRKGGWIAFHDYNEGYADVYRFFNELEGSFDELNGNKRHIFDGVGIGVLEC